MLLTIMAHLTMALLHPLPVDFRLPLEFSHDLPIKALLFHLRPHQLVDVVPTLHMLLSQLGEAASRRWARGWSEWFVDQVNDGFFLQVLFLERCLVAREFWLLRLVRIWRLTGLFTIRHKFHITVTGHQVEVEFILFPNFGFLNTIFLLLFLIAPRLLIKQILIMLKIQLPRPLRLRRFDKLIHLLTLVLRPTDILV